MKKIIIALLMITVTFSTTSCGTLEVEEHDVYVTVYPLKYISESLLEDTDYTVDIVPGVTSHEHSAEWAPKQIIAMKNADFLFYIGANYDQYIDKKLNVFEDANVNLIRLENQTEYINYIPGVVDHHDHDENNGIITSHSEDDETIGIDPHFWISPKRMLDVLDLFYDTFIHAYNNDERTITANYQGIKADLEALHIDYQEAISQMTKPVLTSTNLYGYLREDYGFDFTSISPGFHEEPDNMMPQNTEKILMEINLHNVTEIVYEKKKTSPASDYIYEEMIKLGIVPEKLYYDVLQALPDAEVNQGKNYVSEMQINLSIFIQAGN
ncbi:MAG TPA: zinc ABC transporter substrate-binding protein [Candidatus Izemoplasmatales bacterium]|nr:zinc ABC transporter substrate-binding protein [Candidatus Izemoplasmatales bacterium]